MHVVDNADDFPGPGRAARGVEDARIERHGAADVDARADRVRAEETGARERLIDQHHLRLARAIAILKSASPHDTNAHRLQIIPADDARVRALTRQRFARRLAGWR